ncbi:serine protease [Pseudomonas neuropathica]
MNPATQISLTTVRLECFNGNLSGVGTGFLFEYKIKLNHEGKDQEFSVPMIITNKHVVKDCTRLTTTLTLVPQNSIINDSVATAEDSYKLVTIENLQEKIFHHPDPDVDIAAFSFYEFGHSIPKGKKIKIFAMDESFLLSPDERAYTRSIESIIMVGYPNGLWDSSNNRPITRKGVTASHPLHSWNGERKFLIDAACFPGSSGSPVYQFEDGVVRTGETDIAFGTKARLIGILFAGPLISQEGRIEQRSIPTGTSYVAVTNAMMNLGFVANADVIKDLIPQITEMLQQQRKQPN